MQRFAYIAACALCVACAGSQSESKDTTPVRDTESAGTVRVIEEEQPSKTDKEPVVVSTADAVQSPGTQAPTDEMCVPLPVYFEKSSAVLDDEARSALDRVSECLRDRDKVTITVIGHDERRSGKELDDALVAKRTAAVLEYLEDQGIERTKYEVRAGD